MGWDKLLQEMDRIDKVMWHCLKTLEMVLMARSKANGALEKAKILKEAVEKMG